MPKISLTTSNSPLTLTASDLGNPQLLASNETIVLCSGASLVLNLPAVSSLDGNAKIKVINQNGDTTVNTNGTDKIITPAGNATSMVLSVAYTGFDLEAVSGVTGETLPDYWTTPIDPTV